MLTKRQIRLLELLDEELLSCKDCNLWTGGTSKPYWTPTSKYGMIGEAPGEREVRKEPFIGIAGKKLWEVANSLGLKKEDFIIINTVNCRPIDDRGRNSKPTQDECDTCFPYMRKYLKIVKPEKIILLGNFAVGALTGESSGIMKKNSNVIRVENNLFNTKLVLSIHPSMCIYIGAKGKVMLYESMKVFKELK